MACKWTLWGGKKAHGLIQSDTIRNISAVCHPTCEQKERFISLVLLLWVHGDSTSHKVCTFYTEK